MTDRKSHMMVVVLFDFNEKKKKPYSQEWNCARLGV